MEAYAYYRCAGREIEEDAGGICDLVLCAYVNIEEEGADAGQGAYAAAIAIFPALADDGVAEGTSGIEIPALG